MDVVIGWRAFETVFMGEPVKMQIRPLKRAAALLIAPFMTIGDEIAAEIAAGSNFNDLTALSKKPQMIVKMVTTSFEMQALAAEIIPEHVKDLDLTVNGSAPTCDDLANESVLSPLVGAIMAELIKISFFGKRDSKNCAGPSES